MRRDVLPWVIALGVLVLAFFGAVGVLNATVYSANGFVRGYLDALERRDSASALSFDGVGTAEGAGGSSTGSDALLTDDAMAGISAIELVRDTPGAADTHTVVFDYRFANAAAPQRTEFTVVRSGTRFGLFPDWRFVASPLSTVSVTVHNADVLTVNGLDVPTTSDRATGFLAFAPGSYELTHESEYLVAEASEVAITQPGTIVDAEVRPAPNAAFVASVEEQATAFLDDCATQTVLMPTGCPFGESIANRIDSVPRWSIVGYPAVAIVPGDNADGEWRTRPASGTAHLDVAVRSLFDGTVTRFDEDVPFDAEFSITFSGGEPVLRFAG